MRKMVLFLMVLAVFATGVQAHGGSIGLYTSALADDCDADVAPFAPFSIFIVYYRSDAGPDGINGAEFKAVFDIPGVNYGVFTPPAGTLTTGDVSTGIGITFRDGCTGSGSNYVYLGTQQVIALGVFDWTMHVVANPESEPEAGIWVSRCDALKTLAPVLGGWFHEGNGTCTLPTKASSWGAIKSIYTE
ncbi:MAG: hypothetical protein JW746_10270 [Candidatus Krumholzibacteriota bacterium]|nr:hypothetical protein [Candidatus Krumholzibacteriota bacterium]